MATDKQIENTLGKLTPIGGDNEARERVSVLSVNGLCKPARIYPASYLIRHDGVIFYLTRLKYDGKQLLTRYGRIHCLKSGNWRATPENGNRPKDCIGRYEAIEHILDMARVYGGKVIGD